MATHNRISNDNDDNKEGMMMTKRSTDANYTKSMQGNSQESVEIDNNHVRNVTHDNNNNGDNDDSDGKKPPFHQSIKTPSYNKYKNPSFSSSMENSNTNAGSSSINGGVTTSTEDPTAFWLSWSKRQKACFDENGVNTHESGCSCFEGMGSVM
jgi:hypothetical protein